jgi:hypothetical protein
MALQYIGKRVNKDLRGRESAEDLDFEDLAKQRANIKKEKKKLFNTN